MTARRSATFGVWAVGAVLVGLTGAAAPQVRPSASGAGAPRQAAFVEAPRVVRVGVANGSGYTVRTIPVEEYVAGVLVGEAARESPPAALDALAIAVRTYALKNLNRHTAEGFDVCDQTHCQVLRTPSAATAQAAARTASRVLAWRGALAIVYYSASCGGHTAVPSSVWPGAEDPPYLPARADDGCEGSPQWMASLRTADLERALKTSGYRGSLNRVRIVTRDASGRVDRLALDGMTPASLTGQDLRMIVGPQLGWQLVKSTSFDMERDGDGYLLSGHGYGHGVGMCVIGATRLAAKGETAEQLLARYFPGTTIGTIDPTAAGVTTTAASSAPPPPAVVSGTPPTSGPPVAPAAAVPGPPAPSASASAARPPATAGVPALPGRDDVAALLNKARVELAEVLHMTLLPAMSVQVHGTADEFEKATGRHWFTFGAVAGGALHLMPIDQLQSRGVLDRVVRREVVHAMIDEPLRRRPRWVRDGAALYFADPSAGDPDLRGPCPSDEDLDQPVSAGALGQAYARARACFARQVAAGRDWREVR